MSLEVFVAVYFGYAVFFLSEFLFTGANGVCQAAVVQPMAHHSRTSPAGQPEPGAQADVLGAVTAAAQPECGAALRADGG